MSDNNNCGGGRDGRGKDSGKRRPVRRRAASILHLGGGWILEIGNATDRATTNDFWGGENVGKCRYLYFVVSPSGEYTCESVYSRWHTPTRRDVMATHYAINDRIN